MDERPYVASNLHDQRLQVVYAGGWAGDWPIQYPDGRIAYDWPERVPLAAKRLVERAFAATA